MALFVGLLMEKGAKRCELMSVIRSAMGGLGTGHCPNTITVYLSLDKLDR